MLSDVVEGRPVGSVPGRAPADDVTDGAWVDGWVRAAWRRWRVTLAAHAMAVGIGTGLLVAAAAARFSGQPSARGVLTAVVVALVVAGLRVWLAAGWRSSDALVSATEATAPSLQNALRAWTEGTQDVAPPVRTRLAAQARRGLSDVDVPAAVRPPAWALAGLAMVVGALALVLPVPGALPRPSNGDVPARADGGRAVRALDWTIHTRPPAYTGHAPASFTRPDRIDVIEGTEVVVDVLGWPTEAEARLGDRRLAPVPDGERNRVRFTAEGSDVLTVGTPSATPAMGVVVVVTPDAAPGVRIVAPGADLRRATASGHVDIRVTAQDDLGLRDLRLHYTKVSGSGESFTFEDGEWPIVVSRRDRRQWDGTYRLDLSATGLGPGDTVVYHAVARDGRAGTAGQSESERFLIEIPKPGALAAGDFSLPEPEDRFALSQRMVIQMTERLLERRPRMSASQYAQEALALAAAQRQVRAEFVFMLGGEVEDEFEEAAHSHEVEAGRLDNSGQGELAEAVRQMSQAETRLTAADLREALPYEYRALAAVQAAFGKARYFMRTLPTPVRIDQTRRLQGDRAEASPSRWGTPLTASARVEGLALLRDVERPDVSAVSVLARVIALDRADAEWVASAQHAAQNGGAPALARLLRARLAEAAPAWLAVPGRRGSVESGATVERRRQP